MCGLNRFRQTPGKIKGKCKVFAYNDCKIITLLFKEWNTDVEILEKAKGWEPILWFRCGPGNYTVIIKGHVVRQKTEIESFFLYFSSFSVFYVDWSSWQVFVNHGHFLLSNHKFWLLGLVNRKRKRGLSFLNKNSLELVQKVVLTHHVDSNTSKPPPEVQSIAKNHN